MSIYIQTNQQSSGPFEESAVAAWLQAGQLSPNVLACREGAREWQPLRTLIPGSAQPPAFAGAQPPRASPTPGPESLANWARQNLRNRVDVKLWFNSIAARVFGYGALLFLPAVIFTSVVADMFSTGIFKPQGTLTAFLVTLPFFVAIFAMQLARRNIAKYLDAEGVVTLRGKKHRWESLRHIHYKRVGRGRTVELFFQTGKAQIPSRTHNWTELLGLVATIPVPHRGA
jgi:hypothetical protein